MTRSNQLHDPSQAPAALLPPVKRARSDGDRDFGVADVLALPVGDGELDVYVGWHAQPVAVSSRRWSPECMTWNTAEPLLRTRVLSALAPLLSAGWRLDGTFAVATRWDVSSGSGGDHYEGCWARLRR